jgi:hypothetical protein
MVTLDSFGSSASNDSNHSSNDASNVAAVRPAVLCARLSRGCSCGMRSLACECRWVSSCRNFEGPLSFSSVKVSHYFWNSRPLKIVATLLYSGIVHNNTPSDTGS